MKAYPEYKSSGIDWLGNIPQHWDVAKIGWLFDVKAGGDAKPELYSDIKDDSHPFPVYTNTLIEHQVYAYSSEAPFKAGSITVTGRGDIGHAFVREEDFDAIIRLVVLTPRNNQECTYFKYFIDVVIPFFTDSAAVGQLSASQITKYPIAVPPVSEQKMIAEYLNDVTGKVDALIAEKQKQVEDLRAYRTSLITETVTRGLNPNAPLRPSGIDWLGDIPEHWEITKLKYVSTVQTGSTPSTSVEAYWDKPVKNWFTPGDFITFRLSSSNRKVSEQAFNKGACKIFPKGSILLVGIGATLGKVGIVTVECSANQQVNAITFNDKIYPLYGAYFLSACHDALNSVSNASTLAILNQDQTKQFPIVIPPIDEQQAIAEFLDKKTEKIDALIDELSKQLDELAEYKKAVISEAVTGKVDVRNWTPNN